MSEEIFAPFPETLRAAPVATECRSTVLVSSLLALEARGHLAPYQRVVAPSVYATIKSSVVGQWMPLELAAAHYEACASIGLTLQQQTELGAELIERLRQTFLARIVTSVLPNDAAAQWAVLTKLAHLHGRSFNGGGVQVVKLGPKDARVDVVGFPLARIGYVRQAYRGMVRASARFFSQKAFVTDLTNSALPASLSFRVAWV